MEESQAPQPYRSPPWNRTTKAVVAVIGLAILVLLAWRFQSILGQVITAVILAYLLNPLINFLVYQSKIKRGAAVVIVYLVLLVLLISTLTALGVAVYNQGVVLIQQAPEFISQLIERIQAYSSDAEQVVFQIGGFEITLGRIDWQAVQQQALALVEPAISQSGRYASQLASSTLRMLGQFLFVFIISAYMANEIPQMRSYVSRLTYPAGYQKDAERLMQEFSRIWSAYLRGQVILGLIIFTLVSVSLGLLGVQNALALGAIAGLLEFIPNLGPVISTVIAMIVAFLQNGNYLGLTSVQLMLAVLVVMIIIQQLENNFLVPRVVGEALDLNPILVIIGVLAGASVAGILGAILAAPTLATMKLLGVYAWRKLFDLEPFPTKEVQDNPSIRERLRTLLPGRRRPPPAPPVAGTPTTPSTPDPEKMP